MHAKAILPFPFLCPTVLTVKIYKGHECIVQSSVQIYNMYKNLCFICFNDFKYIKKIKNMYCICLHCIFLLLTYISIYTVLCALTLAIVLAGLLGTLRYMYMMMWEGFKRTVVLASDIQTLAQMMELPHSEDGHPGFLLDGKYKI